MFSSSAVCSVFNEEGEGGLKGTTLSLFCGVGGVFGGGGRLGLVCGDSCFDDVVTVLSSRALVDPF